MLCIACYKLGDKFDLMLECPLYKDIRKRYIEDSENLITVTTV